MSDHPSKNTTTAEDALRALRPEHCVAGDGLLRRVVRLTGRPRKVKLAPDADAREYARRLCEIAGRFVAEDPVVQAVAREHDRADPEILDRALMELAREQAALSFLKQRLLGDGRDCAQVSSRRIEALSKMARIVLERARAGAEDRLDPHDPRVQRIVQAFIACIHEAAEETLDRAMVKHFFESFDARIADWESKVE